MAVQFSANLDLSDANLLGLRLWYRYDQIHALGNRYQKFSFAHFSTVYPCMTYLLSFG